MFFEFLSVYNTVIEGVKGIFFGPFLEIIKNWWWLVLLFILVKPFLFFWHWWRFEIFLKNVFKPILLEIKIPKEISKPIRAMEDVMNSLHRVVYHPPNWWEEWVEGQFQTSIGLEIVSIEGKIRFFIRVHEGYLDGVKAAIYSQYPDVEITEVDDYAKLIPQDIPNKDWDLWGSDYKLTKADCYPILTYKSFEKEQEPVEERIVDPVASLLEALSRIGPGEQFWIQMSAKPMDQEKAEAWVEKSKLIRDKLAKRPVKTGGHKPMVLEAAEILITGKVPGEPKKPEIEMFIPPEMRMTPGEREIVASIEEKMSKAFFSTTIRFIYLGKRDVFVKPKLRLAFTFFGSFYTQSLNGLVPDARTLTKIKKSWFLPLNLIRPRRMYLRQRKLFRNYVSRLSPFFPRSGGDFMLNIEELASLFHFPSWRVAPVPGVSRIEAKKKPPPELPKE
ncbi:MAG: hypothetical protein ACKKMV_00080 [Candidatus Nealsonbacteria bacterium]|nr:MAG: hypothetical protein IB617_01655 [Candidatus Nealsonbacteria bacterium]